MAPVNPYIRDSEIRRNTVQQIEDFCAWQTQQGRGDWEVRVDQRGLGYLLHYLADKLTGMLNIVTQPDGQTHDAKRKIVFLSVRF